MRAAIHTTLCKSLREKYDYSRLYDFQPDFAVAHQIAHH